MSEAKSESKAVESSQPTPALSAEAAEKARLKEERRRLKDIELKKRGIDTDKKDSKSPISKAERRALQEQQRASKQHGAQAKAGGSSQQHRDGGSAASGTRDAREVRLDAGAQHSASGTAAASTTSAAAQGKNTRFSMANRVIPEDKRMYLYLHLDTPQHPPSSATALEVVQSLSINNPAATDHGAGDAAAFAAGIRNAEFPPGPHVIAGMTRDDYVAASTGEPCKVGIAGPSGEPAEALLSDAIPPFSNGLGQRKVAKLSSSMMGIAIHPRIKEVGLRMATMEVSGANARVVSVLAAFADVIADYTPPPQTALYRNLAPHLSAQINFLVYQRPMSTGMGNAIRWLKSQIQNISADMNDDEAKSKLVTMISDYVKERITAAGDVIAELGVEKIQDGDVILTYGNSSTVQRLLIAARDMGRRFRVIVVDSRPHNDGRKLVHKLVAAGFSDLEAAAATTSDSSDMTSAPANHSTRGKGRGRNGLYGGVTYAPITALSFLMREASKVFLGAESFFANGAMLSRAGTAMVALSAHSFHVPVIVPCETYKFSEKIQLDAVVSNELGVPDALMYKTGVPDAEPVGLQCSPSLAEMEYSAYARDRYSARPRWNNRSSLASDTANEAASVIVGAAGKRGKGSKVAAPVAMSDEAKALARLNISCPLSEWRSTHNLRLMNLTQDITPPEFVSVILTEVGMIPTTSIPVVLREYQDQL
ncbi:hypothetical protein GGH94_005958 [Coemansia aciculifera]|uniref:Translation initiation factor eIF2B subunit delta n=2 Tax=Coemansia TaxID=4863 RepID=A0A9W8LAN9_9FUNG|nr:hypothetical protein GGI19_003063 [Coemansia pectinata]KAJ2859701.1 hypothetical protein GGH94_005958 [Coemansia aciculifera]KAJ2871618.1 hypothetical protein GGH93_004682 [Coemansia aciculifera]